MSSINAFHETEPTIDIVAVDDVWLVYDTSTGRTKQATTAQAQADVVALTGSSTAATLSGAGTSALNSTAASAYVLSAPVSGQVKHLVQTTSSTAIRTVTGTTVGGATFVDSTKTILTFTTQGQAAILKGISATQWAVMSNVGTVASS